MDADNTPREIIVWVCSECGYWRSDKSTGKHVAPDPVNPNGRMLTHSLVPTVYAALTPSPEPEETK